MMLGKNSDRNKADRLGKSPPVSSRFDWPDSAWQCQVTPHVGVRCISSLPAFILSPYLSSALRKKVSAVGKTFQTFPPQSSQISLRKAGYSAYETKIFRQTKDKLINKNKVSMNPKRSQLHPISKLSF